MNHTGYLEYLQNLSGIYQAPPSNFESEWHDRSCTPNGPFMGNGDMHVILLGDLKNQEFHISKSDMWTDEDSGRNVRAVTTGGVTIRPQEEPPCTEKLWKQEQRFWDAKVSASSAAGFVTEAFVAADENILFLEIQNSLENPLHLNVDLWAKEDDPTMPAQSGWDGSILWASRETSSGPRGNGAPARWVSRNCLAAAPLVGKWEVSRISDGRVSAGITLEPGRKCCLGIILCGGKDAWDAPERAVKRAALLDIPQIERLEKAHKQWWHDFWEKSYIWVPDQELENFYIGALYLFACVNRAEFVPAGQYPFCRSDDPAWAGDYHMDQEYLGQNEGFFSANRPELSDGVFRPLQDFMETGRQYAQTKMTVVHPSFQEPREGVLYPVGLGPWGVDSTVHDNDGEPWLGNMVSDASYTGMLFIWQYEYYQDKEWLREVGYPFIRELAMFWNSHIRLIGEKDPHGNFCTYGATYEEAFGRNPVSDLGLIRKILESAVQYSRILSVDSDQRRDWQEILEHLPPFPTIFHHGKEVFAEYENAPAFRGGCELTAIFPAETVSPLRTPEWIPIAHHSLDLEMEMLTKPFHSAVSAARVGYPIEKIVKALKEKMLNVPITAWMGLRENFTIGGLHYNGEFIEWMNSSLLQSQDGVIQLFPNWYRDRPAEFHRLRAKGAFLVSAKQDSSGKVTEASIFSEKGLVCTVKAPASAAVLENGTPVPAEHSVLPNGWSVCRFKTEVGGTYQIRWN